MARRLNFDVVLKVINRLYLFFRQGYLVSVTSVFRSSWVSYESHLRVSLGWVYSILKSVLFRVIGLGISSAYGSGGDRGSGGAVSYIYV